MAYIEGELEISASPSAYAYIEEELGIFPKTYSLYREEEEHSNFSKSRMTSLMEGVLTNFEMDIKHVNLSLFLLTHR